MKWKDFDNYFVFISVEKQRVQHHQVLNNIHHYDNVSQKRHGSSAPDDDDNPDRSRHDDIAPPLDVPIADGR